MAIHITTPENSRIIKFEINNMGALKIDAISPQLNVDKLNLETIKGQTLKAPDLKPADYQSILSSIVIGSNDKVLNIQYVNPPKVLKKPAKFEVSTRTIIKF